MVNPVSRASASVTWACAAPRVSRVCWASQAPVEVAADSAAMSLRSAAASTRSRSPASRASARARSTSTVRCSAGVIDHAGAAVRVSRTWWRRVENRAMAWPGSSVRVVVDIPPR